MREHASRELYKTFEQQLISLASQFGIPKSDPVTKSGSLGQSQTQNEKEAPADYNAILREGVAAGNLEIVLKALEKGARLDALDSSLQNVLHVAVHNQRPEVLTTLLAQLQCSNADTVLLQKDSNGQTPFAMAATNLSKENSRTLHVVAEFLLSGKGCQKIAKKEIREWIKAGQDASVKNVFTVFSEANHGIEVLGDIVYRLLGGNFASKATQWVESSLCAQAKDHLWARVYFKALNDGDEVRKNESRETVKKYGDSERRQVVGFMLFLSSGHQNKNIRAGILGELEHLQLTKEIFESSSDGISEIKASLDESVTGQENAKISLAVAIKNHYERLSKGLPKSNILILGPSGTGKTLLVQTIAKTLEVPFTLFDSTNITMAGYRGGKAEDAVKALAENAGFDKARTERGIIFLDEIDKMAGRAGDSHMDEFKRQGQATLLKLLEGIEVEIAISQRRSMKVDTKNILFVCAGAFTGLTDIVGKRLKSEGLSLSENPYEQATAADMIQYGVQPEMLGRLPNVIATRALSVPDLVRILNTPKQSALEEYREIFQSRGVELRFTESAILAIGEKAVTYKTGARALKTVITSVMSDLQFRISQMGLLKSITVTERVVRFADMPTLEYKEAPKRVVPEPAPPAPIPPQPEQPKPEQPQPEAPQ
jgi:ATP-dependent Clp protease ATP-binding subunit ClpX